MSEKNTRSSGNMPKRKAKSSSTGSTTTSHQNGRKHSSGNGTSKESDQSTGQIPMPLQIVSFVVVSLAVIGFLQVDFQSLFQRNNDINTESESQDASQQKPTKIITSWRKANQKTLEKFGSSICNIDRRDVNKLSIEEFERDYRFKKPLIVTFPNGAHDWTDPDRWTVQSLKEEYGQWSIVSGNSREIVRRGGNGDVQTSFTEYVDSLMRSKDDIGEPFYVFDRSFYNDSSLPQTLNPPNYFEIKDGIDDSIFFLGSSGSGVTFHKHADAWNGVIYGQKRWFLYLTHQTPPGGVYPGYTQIEWYQKIYPELKKADKPMECIQKAGEILYLPEGTYHGTINLGDTVAIGIQKKLASIQTEQLFYNVLYAEKESTSKEDQSARKVKIYEELQKLLPDNTEVLMKLGQEYVDAGQLQKGLDLVQRAIDRDPYFVIAFLNKAKTLAKMKENVKAEETIKIALQLNAKLWDVYATYGDFLMQMKRPKEAVEMFKQGTILNPNLVPFWFFLQRAQTESGDTDGAAETAKHIQKMQQQQQQQQQGGPR